MRSLPFWLILLALPACASAPEVVAPPSAERPADNWRLLATEDDRGRIRRWRGAWTAALAKARLADAQAVAREGPLLDPDAAIAGVQPPPGDYRCRTIKLGAVGQSRADFRAGEPSLCRLSSDGARLHLARITGAQRPIGILFPDNRRRMIFLGTLQLGDEALAYRYSRDRERDMIGQFERIGADRWRLVLPYPHFESLLDVIELVPAR
jgi:hypothetical protein